ncbi:MAG: spore germination protein [Desulfotomaculales bacterium]
MGIGEKLASDLEINVRELKSILATDKNFDVLVRELELGRKKIVLYFVDGLTNDLLITQVLERLTTVDPHNISINAFTKLFKSYINFTEVNVVDTYDEIVNKVLSGPLALLVDGEDRALIIDARVYPVRSPDEPDLEKVVRGSRDGFTETLVSNTALIRRRIRDPGLRFEIMQAGLRSKTDIVLAYIEDIANPELVDSVREKIRYINIDGLPMGEKAVEELISPGTFWNPFPRVRYTERPDVAAAHLLDGHVLVLVDTSPSVLILPTTYFHHLQHAEEFRQNPSVGIYLRVIRFLGVAISVFLLPLWLLFALQPELLPAELAFLGPTKAGKIPLLVQFLFAEAAIDMIRLATIHTPSPIATSTGVIAAVLLGDLAARVGLFIPEVVLYTALAAISTFLTPSYELASANRLVRLFLLVLTGLLRLPGFLIGILTVFIFLLRTRSFGIPYLWPLIPFNAEGLKAVLARPPVPIQHFRLSILKPQDRIRQPLPARKVHFLREAKKRKR